MTARRGGGSIAETKIVASSAPEGEAERSLLLGPDLGAGQEPQAIVPEGCWQAAEPAGGWSLLGCTVAPAFEFAGFELAPPDWEPPR